MSCFARLCNWFNNCFSSDIPASQESIIRDLEKIGIITN